MDTPTASVVVYGGGDGSRVVADTCSRPLGRGYLADNPRVGQIRSFHDVWGADGRHVHRLVVDT